MRVLFLQAQHSQKDTACHPFRHYISVVPSVSLEMQKMLYLDMQVWAVNLVLYSVLPKGLDVGEAWISPASWIQLFGFSLLLAGTIIYAQVCYD